MMAQDPIEQAAATYDGWRELSWTVKNMAATLDRVEGKIDHQIETDITNLKLKSALLEQKVESLTKELESKTADSRWMIGALLGLLGFLGASGGLLWTVFHPK